MNGVATDTIKDKRAVNTANTNWFKDGYLPPSAVCERGAKYEYT